MEKRVITIVGPTCSGKTGLSVLLAKKLNTEIISADSRQLYKFLSIGTAKPTKAEQQNVKHHFIDIFTPDINFNINMFEIEALKIIENLHTEGKIPIVVGGSGLYVKALVYGIFDTVDTDENYRLELHELRNKFGNEFLYNRLKEIDPISAEKMLPQNWKRVMRALEVFHLSGKPIWEHQKEHNRNLDIEFLQFGLNQQREILYKNIEKRVDLMIDDGLVEEIKFILEKGYSTKLNSLNTVGYKEIIAYLEGNISLERAIELIKRNTRRFAKRQLTWFRKDETIKWFDVNEKNDLRNITNKILLIL